MKLYEILEKQLKKETNYVTDNGELKKWVVIDKAQSYDAELLTLLLENKELTAKFFIEIKDTAKKEPVFVFNQALFIQFLEQKNYLNDSYTAYKNKVGLNIDGKFLKQRNEISLVWPFKDCVLEGGQSREEDKREEIFFNETLAQDEITQLLEAKVFTNAKRHTTKGETVLDAFKRNEKGEIIDNLIIKGNNLLALHSLKKEFAGKVKLIYIDPPYNTGNDSFKYNDAFNHSTWLTFMKNRLDVAKEMLSEDGSIWINLDDGEVHYCKILCDEVFGRENFVANVIWHKKNVVQNDAKYFNQNHDHILVIAKNKDKWSPNLLGRTEEMDNRYANPDNDPRGNWTSVALQAKSGSDKNIYEITFDNGVTWKPVAGTYPRLNKESLLKAYKEGRLWFGKNGTSVPRLKKYLTEVKDGLVPNTIFTNDDCGSTQMGKEELKKLMEENIFATPKPEKLLKRILEVATSENELVLDFFGGSGTTGAVAHKMKRQYILVEQMDYIHELPEMRLRKVVGIETEMQGELLKKIVFDEGGISKAVNWQGGGEFVYIELKKYNEHFVEQIEVATDTNRLLQIWEEMKVKSFLNYNVDLQKQAEHIDSFQTLTLAQQKQHLVELLDKNQLYVNLSSLNDGDFAVSDEDKKITADFYQLKK